MKSIWFIVQRYPTKDDPICAFIRPVVATIADMGISCTVLSAQSLTHAFSNHEKLRPFHWVDRTEKGSQIHVLQPKYISVSNLMFKGRSVSDTWKIVALKRAIKKLESEPDVVYTHFWDMGVTGAFATEGKYPMIVVSGEERIEVEDRYSSKDIEKWLKLFKGVICVSSKNLKESADCGLLKHNPKTIVLPNSVEQDKFYLMDKKEARDKLGFHHQDTIAIFVGAFIERKGVLRVIEAARQLPNLKLIIVGKGPQTPVSEQIIFTGLVPHEELVTYLNAADMFVLPTLAEGCCNAIVEAMTCGLPVISSDRSFNDDILDESNSIRINPTSIQELADAMKELYNDEQLRGKLSQGALEKGRDMNIEVRAKRIVEFIDDAIK